MASDENNPPDTPTAVASWSANAEDAEQDKRLLALLRRGFIYIAFYSFFLAAAVCSVAEAYIIFCKDSTHIAPWIHHLSEATPLAFIASLSATALLVFEHLLEFRSEAVKYIHQYKGALERLKEQMVSEFAQQVKGAARLVDVTEEIQIGALYRDAIAISGYFPVHTVLRDYKDLRSRFCDIIKAKDFSKYQMILGRKGFERMEDIARKIHDETKQNAWNVLQTLLKERFQIRADKSIDEIKDVPMSFFIVRTPSEQEKEPLSTFGPNLSALHSSRYTAP